MSDEKLLVIHSEKIVIETNDRATANRVAMQTKRRNPDDLVCIAEVTGYIFYGSPHVITPERKEE